MTRRRAPSLLSSTLSRAVAAEHAAIHAYGQIGVRLEDGDLVAQARAAEAAHRDRRDTLVVLLGRHGMEVPSVRSDYELPFAVTDRESALRLAVLVEERVAAVWRAALARVDPTYRRTALDALMAAAVQATRWRLASGTDPAVVPFPGEPG